MPLLRLLNKLALFRIEMKHYFNRVTIFSIHKEYFTNLSKIYLPEIYFLIYFYHFEIIYYGEINFLIC